MKDYAIGQFDTVLTLSGVLVFFPQAADRRTDGQMDRLEDFTGSVDEIWFYVFGQIR